MQSKLVPGVKKKVDVAAGGPVAYGMVSCSSQSCNSLLEV